MSVKKKKWIIWTSVVLCLLFSLYCAVIQFSWDNLQNVFKEQSMLEFPTENLLMSGWSAAEDVFLADDPDSTVTVQCEKPVYVNNILIEGCIEGDITEVTVFYTSHNEAAEQSERKSISLPVEIKNQDTYLVLNETVSDIQMELSDEAGDELELERVVLNPQKLNVDYQILLLSFLVPLLLILFAVELICERDSFVKTVSSLKNYRYLLWDLVSRDVKTKYRRSVLGILWSVLNPLLMMLVITAVFSNIFRYDIKDFPVYYLTGYILFNFVSEATNFSMVSIIGASGLIKKVYIPKFIFPLEKCLYALVNFLFSLIAAVLVFLVVGVTPSWSMLLFPLPVLYLFIFNFGLSLILATINTFFRDAGYLYGVFITLWMYLTPIIYPMSVLPAWMQSIIRFNPLFHYVEYFRAVTIYGTVPSLMENLICIAYALIFLIIGVLVFQKKQNKFIFYI